MNKTKIDWCDMSWNPVTGCLRGCKYCYAERIANRFGMLSAEVPLTEVEKLLNIVYGYELGKDYQVTGECISINSPVGCEKNEPYPFNFRPTLHKYRLGEVGRKAKPQNIFVCSMADLFGEWVPENWITEIFNTCLEATQHRYLFLTRNPSRYYESLPLWKRYHDSNIFNNIWLGATGTGTQTVNEAICELSRLPNQINKFISIEPLLNEIEFAENITSLNWIIVGAQTGPGAKEANSEWVECIISQARKANIPLFLKDNLNWPKKIQEYPW